VELLPVVVDVLAEVLVDVDVDALAEVLEVDVDVDALAEVLEVDVDVDALADVDVAEAAVVEPLPARSCAFTNGPAGPKVSPLQSEMREGKVQSCTHQAQAVQPIFKPCMYANNS